MTNELTKMAAYIPLHWSAYLGWFVLAMLGGFIVGSIMTPKILWCF